jgi:hypothetical protein
MRKMLLTLTTVGLLAVPAGMAMAQSDTTEPVAPVPTCVDHERDRDRDRSADQAMPGAQDQQRTQQRTQEQLQEGTCDGDCPGDQARNEHRWQDQAQLTDGAMRGRGPMGEARNG